MPRTLRRHQHVFDPDEYSPRYDHCLRCGIYFHDQIGNAGCEAPGINDPAYYGFALTVAEQALAKADGLDHDDGVSRKAVAMFGLTADGRLAVEGVSADEAHHRREGVELAALARFEQYRLRA